MISDDVDNDYYEEEAVAFEGVNRGSRNEANIYETYVESDSDTDSSSISNPFSPNSATMENEPVVTSSCEQVRQFEKAPQVREDHPEPMYPNSASASPTFGVDEFPTMKESEEAVTSSCEDALFTDLIRDMVEYEPELVYQSPSKDIPPSTVALHTPTPPLTPEKYKELMKIVPFLTIPKYYGFQRRVSEFDSMNINAPAVVPVVYEIDNVVLSSIDEVHKYLLENNINLPVSCFTFEPEISLQRKDFKPYWKDMIYSEDLSEGQENIPMQVICSKMRPHGMLAEYVKECYMEEDMKLITLNHDDEFFACCDCPNDCKDKLNCPCFLKTLDNCSSRTREREGDENIGYHYQRLYKQYLSGIFECNKMCKCRKSTCVNSVVQNGIQCTLQLFMTKLKGWGVRTLCDIPAGTFVCTYAGAIVSSEFADKVGQDMASGKWKYLSELRVGEEEKEGYEAEVVDPEENSDDQSTSTIVMDVDGENQCEGEVSEEVTRGLSDKEWIDFLNEETQSLPSSTKDCDRAPSPSTSCFMTPSVVLQDGDEDEDEDENGSISQCAPRLTPPPPSMSAQRQLKKRAHPVTDRVLRKFEIAENPQEYDMLPTGRMGFMKRSLSDVMYLSQLNENARRLSNGRLLVCKRPQKVTTYVYLSDYKMMTEGEDRCYERLNSKKRRLEDKTLQQKREENLKQSSRLSSGYVLDHVLKSFKSPLDRERNEVPIKDKKAKPALPPKKRKRTHQIPPSNLKLGNSKKLRRRKKRKFLFSKRQQNSLDNTTPKTHPLLDFELNIDGREKGNIGRYLNHSCDPNLFPQYVFVASHDLRLPQIAFFAKRNIVAGEELAWDYKYDQNSKDVDQNPPVEEQQLQENQDKSIVPTVKKYGLLAKTRVWPYTKRPRAVSRLNEQRRKHKKTKVEETSEVTRLECHCGHDNCASILI